MNHIGTSRVYFWISVILPLLLLAGTAAYVALSWDSLPELLPDHFNAAGQPDGWSGRGSLWISLGLGAMLYVLMLVLSFFPQAWNVRGLGKRADPTLALVATGGVLADFRITVPALMAFLTVWSVLGAPGPGWVEAVAAHLLVFAPMIRFLLRVYVIRR